MLLPVIVETEIPIIGDCCLDSTFFRIVIVSSMAHEFGSMNWDDLNWEKSYDKVLS